jgi:hypothetical protein
LGKGYGIAKRLFCYVPIVKAWDGRPICPVVMLIPTHLINTFWPTAGIEPIFAVYSVVRTWGLVWAAAIYLINLNSDLTKLFPWDIPGVANIR